MVDRWYFFKDLWHFLRKNKAWWIIPLIIFLILIGLLIFFSSTAPVPIFVYPLI